MSRRCRDGGDIPVLVPPEEGGGAAGWDFLNWLSNWLGMAGEERHDCLALLGLFVPLLGILDVDASISRSDGNLVN